MRVVTSRCPIPFFPIQRNEKGEEVHGPDQQALNQKQAR